MTIITISDLLTIIFVLVDDWHQVKCVMRLKGKAGVKAPDSFRPDVVVSICLKQLWYDSYGKWLCGAVFLFEQIRLPRSGPIIMLYKIRC